MGVPEHELTQQQVEALVRPIPGDFVVYLLVGRKMKILYYADSILGSFGVSAEAFEKATADDALDVVMPNDREYVIDSVYGKPVGSDIIECFFRLMHAQNGFFWVHSKSRVIGTMQGNSIILTNYLNATTEAESYSRILDDTDVSFYTVDIKTYDILYANHATTSLMQGKDRGSYAGLPCYKYFFSRSTPCDDCPIGRLGMGETDTIEHHDDDDDTWQKILVKRVEWYDHDCIEFFSTDITEAKHEQESFRQSIGALLAANPNALCIFQVNISQNICINGHGASKYIMDKLDSNTADSLFANVLSLVGNTDERARLEALFNREKLLSLFEQGQFNVQIDYRRKDENDKLRWVRTCIVMLKNPETQDVESVFYSLDVTAEKQQEKVLDIITSHEFDYIALLHVETNKLEYLNLNSEVLRECDMPHGRQGELCDFDEMRELAASVWVDGSDRDAYLEASSADTVIRNLDENGRYEISVRGHCSSNPDAVMCRKIQHSYLDDEKKTILIVQSDVTETYLRQMQNQENQLLDTIGILPTISVLYTRDDDGKLTPVRYSDDFCKLKGCTQENIEEFNSADGFAPVYPEDRESLLEQVQRNSKDSHPHNAVYRINTKNRGYIWVSVNYVHFNIGGTSYLYVIFTDIDDLKKQEQRLEEQYDSAQSFLDSVSETYLATRRVNLTRNEIESVKGTEPLPQIIGVTDYDAAIGELIAAMPKAEDRKECAVFLSRESLIKSYESGKATLSKEYQYSAPSGTIAWVRNTINLTKRPGSGDIICFSAVSDISREKFFDAIVSENIARQSDNISCIDANDGSVYMVVSNDDMLAIGESRRQGSFEAAALAYGDKFVIPEEQASYKKFISLSNILHELEANDRCAASFTVRENGKLRNKRIECFFIDRESKLVAIMRSDFTEMQNKQLKQEEALRDALASAEMASKAKSEFLSRMSHDIRTPLNGIIGMTYLASEQDNPEETDECLEKIHMSSSFLLGLVNDILDMSKAESGKMELHPEEYPVEEFYSYIDAVIRPLCDSKNQTFVFDSQPTKDHGRDSVPMMDKLRINQVYFNLLSNAVKYTPEGGIITLKIREHVTDHSTLAVISDISDTGIGISEEFQKTLFNPFTQENRNDTAPNRGSGLGLSIVKKVIDLMGGTIAVESKLGEGTTFHLFMEFEIAAKQDGEKLESQPDQTGFSRLVGKHVLLCEDHPINQEIAKALLAEKGVVVDTADNGQLGVEKFIDSPVGYYDCMLMDIRMPVMDGYEATIAIRSLDRPDSKSVPIFAMTADAFAEDVQKCFDSGMNAHIAKPIDPMQMYSMIASAL